MTTFSRPIECLLCLYDRRFDPKGKHAWQTELRKLRVLNLISDDYSITPLGIAALRQLGYPSSANSGESRL